MKKSFTIHVSEIGGWWSAICPELGVSGFGSSKKEAIEAVVISMRSTLRATASMLCRETKSILKIATVVR